MSGYGKGIVCWRAGLRPLVKHPRSSLLSVASIALGVAVFLSIAIANRGAVESFHHAFAQITGNADLEIRGDLPETAWPAVQRCEGVAGATPLVEAMVTLPDFPGESMHLVGIDPFTAGGILSMEPRLQEHGGEGGGLLSWLGSDAGIAASAEFFAKHHLRKGDEVRLQGPGAPRRMRIGFEIGSNASPATDGRVAVMDIAAAQEWVGTPGKLTALLIRIKNPEEREMVAGRIRKILPPNATIEPPASRTKQVDVMLSAFRMNLTALSLVSLMVGMFFVGNSAAASVIRRRVSIGMLRAVGMGQGMILGMVLVEAALCGLIGAFIGIAMAPLLSGILAVPVAQTVTALYLPVESQGGGPSFLEGLAGVLAGVGSSLVAAWIPARQAAAVDPTQVLHPGTAPEIFPMPSARLAGWGIMMLLAAFLLSLGALHGGSPFLGFVAAFLVMAGFSLFVPAVTRVIGGFLGRRQTRRPGSPILRLALEQTLRSLHRTAPTIAALAAAVSMTVGISVMIHSFRGSVIAWADRTLTADLFIAPAANELVGLVHTLPAGALAWWEKQRGAKAIGTFREFEVRAESGEAVTLGVISGPARGAIDCLHGDGEKKTKQLFQGEGVALSESLSRRLRIGPGEVLVVATPRGPLPMKVLDLYRDYTRDRGMALIGADMFRSIWGDQGIHSLAIEFAPGMTSQDIAREGKAFTDSFGGRDALVCYSNRSLKARIVEIFNQTFAVTAVLRTISMAVAVGGVMLTLGMLVLERARDIGVLRAMGASSPQIIRMMLAESALIGMIASVVGLVSGAVLALVLTWVINKAFFGWSIDLSYPWMELLAVPLWMTGSAVLAGIVPAWGAAAIRPAAALRME